ncbi:uncharacterized protein LOC125646182 [Ostrea edulis]|uniref:uncharacterized protein LOC125646182 n=1 Tax=Ostrea edulis TaxID=37623 RepID=UPI0024AEFBD9|nr:uncharacterized protein LOC125646182 [Ostrea edulis]
MFSVAVLSVLAVSALALPIKREDDYQHWVDTWKASANDVEKTSQKDIDDYTRRLVHDLDEVIKNLNVVLSGKGTDEDGMKAMYHIGGMMELLKVDSAEEKSIQPMELPPEADDRCGEDAVAKQEGCDAMFGLILSCVRDGVVSVRNKLTSDDDTVSKISYAKAVINKIGAGAEGIFKLAEACYGDKKKNPYQHWIDTWTVSADQAKELSAAEVADYTTLLLRDLGDVVKNFDVLLSGKGGKKEGILAMHHLGGMLGLLKLDAESGGGSIKPMVLPADSDKGCTPADIEKQDGCDAKFGMVLKCIRGGVVAVMDFLKGNEDTVTKIKFAKAVINEIGAGAEGVFKLAEACYGDKSENENPYQHWVDTWKASENDVKQASDEEIKQYTGLLLRDLQDVIDNLKVLLSGKGTKEEGIRAMQHIGGMMELLKIDAAEGEDAIPPMILPADSDKGCTAADVEKQDSCDAKFGVIMGCVKGGLEAVVKALKSDMDVLKKISFAKAVINKIGAGAKDIFYLAGQCYGGDSKTDEYQHWVDTWRASKSEVEKASPEEIQKYTDLLVGDITEVVDNIDVLLSGKGTDENGEEAMKHFGGMMELVKLHAASGEDAIQPMKLPPGSDKGCTAADVEEQDSCDAKFGVILSCTKKGLTAVINDLKSKKDAVKKISFAKAVIHSIGEGAEGVYKLAEYCYGDKKEKRMETEKKSKARLERLLREYLNTK